MLGFEGFVLLILFCEREIYTNGMGFTNGIFGVWGSAFYITFFLKEERNSTALGYGRNGLPNKRSSCFYNIPLVSS